VIYRLVVQIHAVWTITIKFSWFSNLSGQEASRKNLAGVLEAKFLGGEEDRRGVG